MVLPEELAEACAGEYVAEGKGTALLDGDKEEAMEG